MQDKFRLRLPLAPLFCLVVCLHVASVAWAQSISIFDCQGILRQKVFAQAGESKDLTINFAGETQQVSAGVVKLKNVESGLEVVRQVSSSSAIFSNVAPGNYMLVTEGSNLSLVGISVSGVGATLGGTSLVAMGVGVGASTAVVGGAIASSRSNDTINGAGLKPGKIGGENQPKEPPGGDQGLPGQDDDQQPPMNPEDCNCDPEAQPEPLSPDEFFAAKQKFKKISGIQRAERKSNAIHNAFKGKFWSESLSQNWLHARASQSDSSFPADFKASPNNFAILDNLIEVSSVQSMNGRGNANLSASLLKIGETGEFSALHAVSVAEQNSIIGSAEELDTEVLSGLKLVESFEGYTIALGWANFQSIPSDLTSELNVQQKILSLNLPLTSNLQIQPFISNLSTSSEKLNSVGISALALLTKQSNLNILMRNSNSYEGSDFAFEIMWSQSLP